MAVSSGPQKIVLKLESLKQMLLLGGQNSDTFPVAKPLPLPWNQSPSPCLTRSLQLETHQNFLAFRDHMIFNHRLRLICASVVHWNPFQYINIPFEPCFSVNGQWPTIVERYTSTDLYISCGMFLPFPFRSVVQFVVRWPKVNLGHVEVARAPGAICRRSAHKYAVPSNHV